MTVKELAVELMVMVVEGKGNVNVMLKDKHVSYPILHITESQSPPNSLPEYHWVNLSFNKEPIESLDEFKAEDCPK